MGGGSRRPCILWEMIRTLVLLDFNDWSLGTGENAQWLGTLPAFAENLGSVHSTHVEAHCNSIR